MDPNYSRDYRTALAAVIALCCIAWCNVHGSELQMKAMNKSLDSSMGISSCRLLNRSHICFNPPTVLLVDLIPYKRDIDMSLLRECCGGDARLKEVLHPRF